MYNTLCIYIYIYAYVYIYIYVHTYIYIYIYIYLPLLCSAVLRHAGQTLTTLSRRVRDVWGGVDALLQRHSYRTSSSHVRRPAIVWGSGKGEIGKGGFNPWWGRPSPRAPQRTTSAGASRGDIVRVKLLLIVGATAAPDSRSRIGWQYFSNATCLIQPHLCYVFVCVSRIIIIC